MMRKLFGVILMMLSFSACGQGVLLLRFDDRNFTSWIRAVPVFERYGAHATFFVNGKIDGKTIESMKILRKHGHSLGSHTMRHGDVPALLAKLGKDAFLSEEIEEQLVPLRKTGLVFRNFGYPSSKRTEESDRLLLGRFDRISVGGFWEYAKEGRLEKCDPLFFPASEIAERRIMMGTSIGACRPTVTGEVAKVLRRLDERDEAIVLYAHNIRFDDKHDDHDLNIGELDAILRMAQSLGVRVAGFDDFPWIEKISDNGLSCDRQRVFSGFDGKTCKVQPMIADDGRGTVLLSYQRLLLGGSDIFSGQFLSRSTDGGRTWSIPREQPAMADTRDAKGRRVAHYATVYYSQRNGRWFALGNDETYGDTSRPLRADHQAVKDGEVMMRPLYYSVDPDEVSFTQSSDLPFPFPYVFCKPFGQIVEEDDGTLLVGFYYCPRPAHGLKTAVVFVRYRFEGESLSIVEAGVPIERYDLNRGVCEPSLVRFGDRYLLTLRSDEQGLVAVSSDGLRFTEPQPWMLDDGTVLANRNTQQHWVLLGSKLFLAYTRVDASNAHVFRNRAPIFLTEVDARRLCLKRSTERPIVPERGARLGNFCVASASDGGEWLVVSEWMQPPGCEKHGSDNSIWIVKLHGAFSEDSDSCDDDRRLPFADPFVLYDGGMYYAYGTFSPDGIAVAVSKDLKRWEMNVGRSESGLALFKGDTYGEKWFWAPEVYRVGERYIMFYSADEHVCAAVGDGPLGPFRQIERRPLIPEMRAIDNSLFFDKDGNPWMVFVKCGNEIWVAEMQKDCLHVKKESMREILCATDPWELKDPKCRVAEGPFVIYANGVYILTYSCNHYLNPDYAVGFATASNPSGPWTKSALNPILHRRDGEIGTGHHSIFRDEFGKFRIVYHVHNPQGRSSHRLMNIAELLIGGKWGEPEVKVVGETIRCKLK